MVSRRTRVACWIFRRDHPSRPKAMICCFFSSFKTFAMLREATNPPAAVNVLVASSESMAAFQVFMYGRFWVFTEVGAVGFETSQGGWDGSAQTGQERPADQEHPNRYYDLLERRARLGEWLQSGG